MPEALCVRARIETGSCGGNGRRSRRRAGIDESSSSVGSCLSGIISRSWVLITIQVFFSLV